MTREECLRLWKAEEREPFQGWDFSHLNGRGEAEELPWNYQEELEPYLNYRTMLLDMGTGGGEFLLSLNPPKGRTYATEGYLPNVDLCRRRLPIHGIELRQVFDDSDLPFDDEMFDLVINRQEAYDPDEVFRVLKPGGLLLNFDADYAANVRSHSMQNCKVAPDSPYGHIGMTDALQHENDEITLTMDIGQLRPAWDLRVLRRIGFSDCRADATVGQRILGASDLTHAPMFGIWARKA